MTPGKTTRLLGERPKEHAHFAGALMGGIRPDFVSRGDAETRRRGGEEVRRRGGEEIVDEVVKSFLERSSAKVD